MGFFFAMQLVSCVPSLSELIYFLNPSSLIGRTRFCIYPNQIKSIPTVGGTKNLDLKKIQNLKPDLIIGTKEENEASQFEVLGQQFPTCIFDIKTVEDSISCIAELGTILSCQMKANKLIEEIKAERIRPEFDKKLSAIYLIWKNPWMTVGGDTFINSMMNEAGLVNLFERKTRYPQIELLEELKKMQPDLVLLSTEPFPFKMHHVEDLKKMIPNTKVILVDGTYFSWYGNRVKDAYLYFSEILENQIGKGRMGNNFPA
ncbi:MAG TPA: helical backbone metal receptor [Catalimonadaceae bacterium]|nr:helical backbone metal receptor [Catalimonadaceae bacterium]